MMKRHKRCLAAILAATLLCFAVPVQAETSSTDNQVTVDGLIYTIENNEATLVDGCDATGTLVLPAIVENVPLTQIGRYAFSSPDKCASITSISIPATVVYIGECGLSVDTLQEITFRDAQDDAQVTRAAQRSTAKREIDNFAFRDTKLKSIQIPGRFERIGVWAFEQSTVENIVLEDGIKRLDDYSLSARNLRTVSLPDSVTEWGECVLWDTSLTSLTLPSNMEKVPDNLCGVAEKLDSVTFPKGITHIGAGAFSGTALQHVDLPSTVQTIGANAFAHTPLKDIQWPEALKVIETGAFQGTSLQKVEVPSGVTRIGEYAFALLDVKQASFPGSVTELGDYVFGNMWQDTFLETLKFGGTMKEWNGLLQPDPSRWTSNPDFYAGVTVQCSDGTIEPTWTPQCSTPEDLTPQNSWYEIHPKLNPQCGWCFDLRIICRRGSMVFDKAPAGIRQFSEETGTVSDVTPVQLKAGDAVTLCLCFDDQTLNSAQAGQEGAELLSGTYTGVDGSKSALRCDSGPSQIPTLDSPVEVYFSNNHPRSGETVKVMLRSAQNEAHGMLYSPQATTGQTSSGVLLRTYWGDGMEYDWPEVSLAEKGGTTADRDAGWGGPYEEWVGAVTVWGNPGDTIQLGFAGTLVYEAADGWNYKRVQNPNVASLTIADGTADAGQSLQAPPGWYISASTYHPPYDVIDAVLRISEDVAPDKISWSGSGGIQPSSVSEDGLTAWFPAPTEEGTFTITATIQSSFGPVYVSHVVAIGMDKDIQGIQLYGPTTAATGETVTMRAWAAFDANINYEDFTWKVSPAASLEADHGTAEFQSFVPGPYEVTASVRDSSGALLTATHHIVVTAPQTGAGGGGTSADQPGTPEDPTTNPDQPGNESGDPPDDPGTDPGNNGETPGTDPGNTGETPGSDKPGNTGNDPESPTQGAGESTEMPRVFLNGPTVVTVDAPVTFTAVLAPETDQATIAWSLSTPFSPTIVSEQGRSITFIPRAEGYMSVYLFVNVAGREVAVMADVTVVGTQPAAPDVPSGGTPVSPAVPGLTAPVVPGNPAPSADASPTAAVSAAVAEHYAEIDPSSRIDLVLEEQGEQRCLRGLSLASETLAAGDLKAHLVVPEGTTLHVVSSDGDELSADAKLATGSVARIVHPDKGVLEEIPIIVQGDVLGTGEISVAQLVRMAQALKQRPALEGPYLQAAKWTSGDRVMVSDLVAEAKLLRSSRA